MNKLIINVPISNCKKVKICMGVATVEEEYQINV
jgi:hypothetical protein